MCINTALSILIDGSPLYKQGKEGPCIEPRAGEFSLSCQSVCFWDPVSASAHWNYTQVGCCSHQAFCMCSWDPGSGLLCFTRLAISSAPSQFYCVYWMMSPHTVPLSSTTGCLMSDPCSDLTICFPLTTPLHPEHPWTSVTDKSPTAGSL